MRIVFGLMFMALSASALAKLTVSDASIRLLPPTVPNTSAYFTISNSDSSDRVIVAAFGDISPRIELHEHSMQGEMMRMRQVEEVIVPAGDSVTFAPGGLHLMIFGLTQRLNENQKIKLTLEMKNGEKLDFIAEVKSPMSHSQHH